MKPYPVCYIFCYDEHDLDGALLRLKLSISSLPSNKSITILTWHDSLPSLLNTCSNIKYIFVQRQAFSRSFFINYIAKYLSETTDLCYFYLADTDLFFHPSYFSWLDKICLRLDSFRADLRVITSNINLFPECKIPHIPRILLPRTLKYFPQLFRWTPPSSFSDIIKLRHAASNFAHGCGLIPIAPLLRIGGYNSEIVGYGPEDDLFNQRLKNYARIYYHKGSLVSSTFHIPHKPLQQQNKKKNWMYWSHSLSHQALHGAFSDTVIRVHDL